jgi:hypothetical protein
MKSVKQGGAMAQAAAEGVRQWTKSSVWSGVREGAITAARTVAAGANCQGQRLDHPF